MKFAINIIIILNSLTQLNGLHDKGDDSILITKYRRARKCLLTLRTSCFGLLRQAFFSFQEFMKRTDMMHGDKRKCLVFLIYVYVNSILHNLIKSKFICCLLSFLMVSIFSKKKSLS